MTSRCFGIPFSMLAVVFLAGPAFAGDKPIRSGLQPGEYAVPFQCLNVTGPDKGEILCLVCKNGIRPLAMVFARELSSPLKSLLKQLDAAVEQNRDADLASFAAFLTEDPDLMETRLKELAEREGISDNVPFAIPEIPTGPPSYNISEDADVTVMLYREGKVVRNFSFGRKELKETEVQRIVASLATILPGKDDN